MTDARRACRLAPRLLAILVADDGSPAGTQWRLRGTAAGRTAGLPARWLDCGTVEGGEAAHRSWLFTAAVPDVLSRGPLGPLSLSDGDRERRLELQYALGSPAEFAQAIKDTFEPGVCGRAQAFLAATPTGHQVDPTPALAGALHEIRERLRPRLPETAIAPGALTARLEQVTAIDRSAFWLTGWIHDGDPRQTQLTAISPEGTRAQPQPGATAYHPRPAYASALSEATRTTLGFHAYIELPNPSIHPHGWLLELRGTNGQLIQASAPDAVNPDVAPVWQSILAQLRAGPADETALRRQILPTLEHLRNRTAAESAQRAPRRADPGPRVDGLEVTSAPQGSNTLRAELWPARSSEGADAYAGTYSFALEGVVVAPGEDPVTIEVRDLGFPVARASATLPVNSLSRTPATSDTESARGFRLVVGSLSVPPVFELEVDAVTTAGRTRLATVRGHRPRLPGAEEPVRAPVLVRTLGRSGSNWLLTLLSGHPEVVAYRPFQYEPRLAVYWMNVLRTLTDPVSYMQSIMPQFYSQGWWIGDARPEALPLTVPEDRMPRWLGSDAVEALATFCRRRIDSFYEQVAHGVGRAKAKYFVEKAFPDFSLELVAELYPAGKEVLLVRDFRDIVCSIRDYNRKRGFALWGAGGSDAEWLGYLRDNADRMVRGWRERAVLVRYEQLVTDPVAALEPVWEHLELAADRETTRQIVSATRASTERAQRSHRTSASDEASVGRWRRDLPDGLKAACSEAFEDLLLEFGYEPTRP